MKPNFVPTMIQRVFLAFTLTAFFWSCPPASASGPLRSSAAHGLMLAGNQTVCAVGENSYGQLGDATDVDRWTPVTAYGITAAVSISTGPSHSLAALSNGTVWAWGYNAYGQLGDGLTYSRPTPMPVPALTGMTAVAAGQYHSLALKNDGTVWAWGYNGNGELGDGTSTSRTSPVQVVSLTGVIAIAAGADHSMALKSDGTVWTWGYNAYGQLGNSTTTSSLTAVQVVGLSGVISIDAGPNHSLSLKSDGTVWTWGYNGYGQLGDGSTTSRPNIVRATGLTSITAIAGGTYHSLAVKSDGTAWAWGYNAYGELGDASITQRLTPVQVSGLTGVTAIAGGAYYSQALKSDGSMWAWGYNNIGQLGTGNTTASIIPVASSACASGVYQGAGLSPLMGHLTASQNHTLAVKADATVWAWGENANGELGDGTIIDRPTPVQASGVAGANGISTGYYHSLAVLANGTVSSWGYNGYGQLGQGDTLSRPTPLAVPGLTGVISVSAGQYHSLALKNDGTVWGFGYNGYGNLGDGTTTQRLSPIQVVNLTGAIAIAAGYYHSMALKSDGTVWTWGYNGYGQLGNNTVTSSSNAIQVVGLSGVIAIAAGQYHSMALKSDGTVWAWGYNGYGGLGEGSTATQPGIVRTSGLTGIVAIAAGAYHSLAVKSDGTAWAWGYNASGQLGNASATSSTTPVQVSGVTTALSVAAGASHSLAIMSDGSIWAWGSNSNGQFGVASPASSTVPIMTVQSGFGQSPAVMQSPAPSSTLTGATVTFTWNNAGATAYWLDVGTTAGTGTIFGANVGTATFQTVSGIPTTGQTIYVKLWSLISGVWQSNSYTYTAAPQINPAVIQTPAPGSTLAGPSVTFTWNATGATAYWLDVGTTAGTGNLFGANVGTATSQTVSGIPTAGQTIYVKLWSLISGVWQSNSYTYTAANGLSAAVMQTPAPGSTLAGASVTFTWNASGASAYWLDVGTTVGQGNIFGANVGTATSRTVTGIPTGGQTIYVKLWSLINGVWQSNSYVYTASAGVTAAVMQTPVPGTTFGGSSVTFTWNASGASAYWLDVGTALGQGNIFGANVGTATSQTVSGIPTGGQTIYVKLWSLINGVWQSNAYTYTAANGVTPAVMQTPVPGTTLAGSAVTFTWTFTGAAAYWLDVGTVQGQGNIFGANVGTATSRTVTGIPTNSVTIYVRLWSLINGTWQSNSYTYTAANGGVVAAVIQSPVPGSTLGASATFIWNSTGASAYWLDVGSVQGQGNIFGANVGTATSQTVNGLPNGGIPIYVRLWSLINGVWQYNAYTYTAMP